MNTFVNAVDNDLNEAEARTENGMKARATTANKVLDFFGKAGSSRGTMLTREFAGALTEDTELAMRALLWTRDVRGGAGERKQFRDLLAHLEKSAPKLARAIMHKVPELGRWDDLFTYKDPTNRKEALEFYAQALAEGHGLAFKWAPRPKSARKQDATDLRKVLGMNEKQYRKYLAKHTDVVEQQMCSKHWEKIDFSKVPSLAAARYQRAFARNAGDAYSRYIAELQKPQSERDPKVKINAGAVYPYDVVKSVKEGNKAVANEQWAALPNYVGNAKIMPMVDVSGSMGSLYYDYGWYGSKGPQPIEVAVSLGLYLSEKNTSEYKDLFLTFSGSPQLVKVKGTLSDRIDQMTRSKWGMNTDLHKAFDKLLDVAVKGNVAQEDMPDTLLILSDMQFDHCTRWDDSAQQMIAREYREAGYEMPKIVFWNLNAAYGRDNTPVRFDDRGVALVSGFSPAIMKAVLADDLEEFTPYNVMLQTLMSERYAY